MGYDAQDRKSDDTDEWYRMEFFKERAGIAVEMAKRKFARTLNGNALIPMEAFGDGKAHGDELGSGSHIGFTTKPSKLHDGYAVELLKDGVPFEEIAKDPKVPHIIPKSEVEQWAIRITVPNNLGRSGLVPAFEQVFGKALTKNDFVRKQEGAENGVPLGTITINLAKLLNAPDLKLAYTQDGNPLMVDEAQIKPKMIGDGGRGGGRS